MDIKDLKLQKVTDRIYYLPNLEAFDWPTLGLVIGDKHTLMLDSGRSRRHTAVFLDRLRQNTGRSCDDYLYRHWTGWDRGRLYPGNDDDHLGRCPLRGRADDRF